MNSKKIKVTQFISYTNTLLHTLFFSVKILHRQLGDYTTTKGIEMKKPIPKIDMFKNYVWQLVFRICVFLFLVWAYFFKHEYFDLIITKSEELKWEAMGFTVEEMKNILYSQASIWWVWAIWAIFMLHMISQMIPESKYITMGSRKNFAKHYQPVENFDKLEMYQYVQKNNLGAVWTLLAWLGLNGIIGALYVFGIIGIPELVLVTGAFCVLCDLTLPRLDILLPFSITSGVTVYLVFMEIGSIIENVGLLNPEIGKYLTGIFEKLKDKHENE